MKNKKLIKNSRTSFKNFPLLRVSECPPDPPALLMLATLAFLLIMFTSGIMYVFYLILFPAGFSDTAEKIYYLISLSNKGVTIYQK